VEVLSSALSKYLEGVISIPPVTKDRKMDRDEAEALQWSVVGSTSTVRSFDSSGSSIKA
jgi:hypothetical protein